MTLGRGARLKLDTCDLLFDIELAGQGPLPAFPGTTLRGAFGFALKNIVCHMSHRKCDACLLRMRCAYPVVFEGIPPADRRIMRKYPNVPQPFVLLVDQTPPPSPDSARTLAFGIRLFGPAVDLYPFIAYAVIRMAQQGLGRDRIPGCVRRISDGRGTIYRDGDEGLQPPAGRVLNIEDRIWPASRIRLSTVTPLRLRVDGHQTARPAFADLFRAVLRRVRILNEFYGREPLTAETGPLFDELAASRTVEDAFVPRTIPRFSSRQQARMDIGGLTGYIIVELPEGHLRNWLEAAEILHIGKAASFGLGRIKCEELP